MTDYWIDVREPDEYQTGHYKDAVNIPYESIAQRVGEVTDDKNASIKVYCRTGRRSGIAMDTLKAAGFTQVTNEGGLDDVLAKTQTSAVK